MVRRTRFNNENITETLKSNDLLSGTYSLATVQADYSLSAVDYMMLKNGWVSIYTWAMNIGFVILGYAWSVMPKFLAAEEGKKIDALSTSEWYTLGIGVSVVTALCIIGLFLPNDRKSVMKDIKEHFRKAPKSRRTVVER